MDEIWKKIPGFDQYSVSSWGRVRRDTGKTSNGRFWRGGILTAHKNKYGYWKVTLTREGKENFKVVHRLVCEAFHGPPPKGKPKALHWDDNPDNNTPENLRWGDLSDNQQDILRNGNNHGRNLTHCKPQGHEYTKENTYVDSKGSRSCKACRKDASKRSRNRRREIG